MIVSNCDEEDVGRLGSSGRAVGSHGRDASIDRLCRLAARLFDAPAAFIFSSRGQNGGSFFRTGPGSQESGRDHAEKRLAQSLCLQVISASRAIAINDLRMDVPKGAESVIGESSLVAYLGIPLRASDGSVLGAICVIDRVPRTWTEEDSRDFGDLGEIVAREMSGLNAAGGGSPGHPEASKGTDRREDEFMSVLGHELRSPISAILSALHLARQAGGDAEELDWSHGVIERQCTQLVRLVDDVLDASRIAEGRLRLSRQCVELADVVDRAAAAVRHAIERKCHELAISLGVGPLELDVDPARLEQILVNLLSHAARQTDEGGRIVLAAGRARGGIVVTVSDNGAGISPEMIPYAFDLLSRGAGEQDHSRRGLGIGLNLVRKLAELHGGRADVTSDGPGKGSSFSVWLPSWEEEPEMHSEADRTMPGASQDLRILVVDDNVDSAASMAMLLKVSGHEVRMAHDGDAAIEVAFEQRPDAVLLDIGLPGRDGYAVAEVLRGDERCRDAFIIALSGYGQDEDRRRSSEAGIDAHLVKPVDVDELLKLLAAPRPGGAGT